MKKVVACWIILALAATIIMADNPFGALPGETYEEYNARRMAEVNRLRIQAGLPPIKSDAETGAEIQAALDALEDVKQLKRDRLMPDRPDPREVRRELPDETMRRLLNLLTGIGQVGDVGLGEGGKGEVLLQKLAERVAAMSGSGAAVGIGTGSQLLPATVPDNPESTPVQVLQEFARNNQGFAGAGPSSIPSQGSSGSFDPEALILLLTALAEESEAEAG
jgi:hypothetical protein